MGQTFDINELRTAAAEGRIHWHLHALERFLERGITRAEVTEAITRGEVVESYETGRPSPSCLIVYRGEQPLHVVVAIDSADAVCHVITAYRPDLEHFEADLKTRRRTE